MKVGDLVRVKDSHITSWPDGLPTSAVVMSATDNGVELGPGGFWVAKHALEVVQKGPNAMRDNANKPELNYLLTFGQALRAVAAVSQYGASKYERGNYMKGSPLSHSVDCMLRHLLAWYEGEDIDKESGQPHLGHVAWNALRLCQEAATRPDLDDRICTKKA